MGGGCFLELWRSVGWLSSPPVETLAPKTQVAAEQAGAVGATFGWQLDTVPDAHHSNALMTPAAAAILLQPLP